MTTTETLVDCHFHVFDAGVAVASARYRPPYDAPLEGWLSMAGTVRGPAADPYGVVVQTSFLGTDNSAMLAALRRMPERLRGVAVVDPSAPPAELAALDAAMTRSSTRPAPWARDARCGSRSARHTAWPARPSGQH
jgi:predicted TIM-barrel fold metal-dependent hydrolase